MLVSILYFPDISALRTNSMATCSSTCPSSWTSSVNPSSTLWPARSKILTHYSTVILEDLFSQFFSPFCFLQIYLHHLLPTWQPATVPAQVPGRVQWVPLAHSSLPDLQGTGLPPQQQRGPHQAGVHQHQGRRQPRGKTLNKKNSDPESGMHNVSSVESQKGIFAPCTT